MSPGALFQNRQGRRTLTTELVVVGLCLLSTTLFPSVVSFLPLEQHPSWSHCSSFRLVNLEKPTAVSQAFLSSPSSTAECEASDESSNAAITTTTSDTPPSLSQSQQWLNKGLILSSFTDGLKTNPPALDWLMNALVETLWKEEQGNTQAALKESNIASPCNGPDPVLLEQLESTDGVVEGIINNNSGLSSSKNDARDDWKKQLALLWETKKRARTGGENNNDGATPPPIDLRVLYIPTAMYALRPGSTSKPGKQRGRNRADGKSRRNEIMGLLAGQLQDFVDTNSPCSDEPLFTVRTVTMDLDDASVKQPEEVVVGNESLSTNGSRFPESGKEAIREWKPHLVYVQGGNTFWLHHCLEKGDWEMDLIDVCGFDTNDGTSFPAVYCGVSAGAILAGESMQTACWKEWDDPSVVPGKEAYGDWTDVMGLRASGRASWFPHLTAEWQDLAERKTAKLLESNASSGDEDPGSPTSSVRWIRDDQAFAIDGRTQSITELL